ncbi:MAG: signal peptidase II, partial [Rhabdochlamydiaceae bacterium]
LDIISKGMIYFYFKPFELSPHFFPFGGISIFQALGIDFCIHHVTNKGIAWGLGGGWQDLILFIRSAIIAGLVIYMKRFPKAYPQRYALALIIAGGIGNILDYFIYGHVIDMFHFILWGYSYPVFNIADTSIFFGIVALLWKGWKHSRRQDVITENQ